MDRRKYIKTVLSVLGISIASFPVIKYFYVSATFVEKDLWVKKPIIAELADMIIPLTDSIGAKAAMVEDYIVIVLLNCHSKRQQQRFLSGIKDLEDYAKTILGRDFLKCTETEKVKVLQYFADKGSSSSVFLNKLEDKLFGQRFFLKLRTLTVEGYCQSMLGATQGLAYEAVPGVYVSCTSLDTFQKSWATK